MIGFGVACYLTAYQIGWINSVWDPFFADGPRHVLHSSFSQSIPFPDAGLGAFAYAIDFILCMVGDSFRYQKNPWLMLGLAIVVYGMAMGSAGLIFLQAFIIHDFCSLCLTSAFLSFIIGGLATSEIWAARIFATNG